MQVVWDEGQTKNATDMNMHEYKHRIERPSKKNKDENLPKTES